MRVDRVASPALFGAILVPLSVGVFAWAEAYAKRTGKLKRQG